MADDDNQSRIPTAEEVRRSIIVPDEQGAQERYNKRASDKNINAPIEWERLRPLHDNFVRNRYLSTFIAILMSALVLFQYFLLGMVGAGIWDFSQYAWFLPVLLVQNFAQIIGLALVVVRSLFR